MPKELVFQKTKNGDPDTEAPVVHIGWSRGLEYVEVATVAPDGKALEPTDSNGWFAQLDRAGTNRLINLLRKARDGAYGADA